MISAVKLAGGFTDEASEECVNLASKLEDGEHIKILSKKQYKKISEGAAKDTNSYNFNECTRYQILLLWIFEDFEGKASKVWQIDVRKVTIEVFYEMNLRHAARAFCLKLSTRSLPYICSSFSKYF